MNVPSGAQMFTLEQLGLLASSSTRGWVLVHQKRNSDLFLKVGKVHSPPGVQPEISSKERKKKHTLFGWKHTLFGRRDGGEVSDGLEKKIYPMLFLKSLGPLDTASRMRIMVWDANLSKPTWSNGRVGFQDQFLAMLIPITFSTLLSIYKTLICTVMYRLALRVVIYSTYAMNHTISNVLLSDQKSLLYQHWRNSW